MCVVPSLRHQELRAGGGGGCGGFCSSPLAAPPGCRVSGLRMPLLRVVNTGPVCGCTKRYGSLGSWPGWEDTQVATRRASGRKSSRRLPSNNACMQPDHDTRTRVRREGQASQGRVNARGWRPPAGRCSGEAATGTAPAAAAACQTWQRRPSGEGARTGTCQRGGRNTFAHRSRDLHAHVSPARHACREEVSHAALQSPCPQTKHDAVVDSSAAQPRRVTLRLSEAPHARVTPPDTEAAPWRPSSCAWRSSGALPYFGSLQPARNREHSAEHVGSPRRVVLPPGGSGPSLRSCPRLLTVSAQAAPPVVGGCFGCGLG